MPTLKTFAQQLIELLRKMDDRLAGAGEKVKLRQWTRKAGLTLSEKGISACRRWRWWGWWMVDSLFCGICLVMLFGPPLTAKMSVAFVVLSAGLPWLTVATMAAGAGVIALTVYVPSAMSAKSAVVSELPSGWPKQARPAKKTSLWDEW
ncbi:MAG: hypothetical protein ACE5JS_03275 [Nitrospinota bacterium]